MENTKTPTLSGGEKVKLSEKIAYAIGDPACNVVFALTTSLLTFFYTDYIGISAGVIGMIMLISRVFDGASDVVMGIVTDRTHSKFGKARPWILWMTIPYGLSAIALFLIPANASEWFKIIYVFVTYNIVTTVVYTALTLPYGTLASMMTRDQHERAIINVLRMGLSPFGRMTVTAATIPLVTLLGDDQRAWIIVTSFFSVIAMVMLFISFFGTKERVHIATANKTKIPVWTSIKALLHNKYWAISMALWGMLSVYSTVVGMDLAYYCKYIFGNQDLMAGITVAELAPMIVVIFIMPLGLKRFGKRNLALAGALLTLVGQAVLLINPLSYPLAIISAAIKSVGQAPLFGVIFSLIADSVEYGQWKTHLRQEGMTYSAASIGSKLGAGLTSAVVGGILSVAGYNGLLDMQSQQALSAISGIYLYAPLIVWTVTVLLLWMYKLDEEYPKVIRELAEREAMGDL